MTRNRRHVDSIVRRAAHRSIRASRPALASLLIEAETSGGLLFSVARDRAGGVVGAFAARGEPCWEIGEVVTEPVIRIRA